MKEIYYEVCGWYEGKYGGECFSERMEGMAHRGYETKF